MFTEKDMDAIFYYSTWDDKKFNELTEGPRHRGLIIDMLKDKKSTGLIREAIIAKFLKLERNTRMHSTSNGVTTFDAVHIETQTCYEIKAEQHTVDNPDRVSQSGQLAGVGVFSSISKAPEKVNWALSKLIDGDPMIGHGMFLDGRMLSLVTFRLSDAPDAVGRISDYAKRQNETVPRYSYSDWAYIDKLNVVYHSPFWPENISNKYRDHLLLRHISGL